LNLRLQLVITMYAKKKKKIIIIFFPHITTFESWANVMTKMDKVSMNNVVLSFHDYNKFWINPFLF
jgi:late competence protein required for DNA uptake (superfamily II DNA/RNA helicase)